MDRRMSDGRTFKECNGQLLFSHNDYTVPFSRYFDVKVGAVSGADEIFVHPKGNVDFVCSTTVDDGRPRAAYFDVINPHIERFKDRLLARAVRRFDETNWWKWGRHHHVSNAPRVYVNVKTRRTAPFFANDCKNYDGSVLAVFSKDPNVDPNRLAELLNDAVDWDDLGFVCDGRFLFTQRSLQTCFLPETFSEKWHALFGMHGLSHQI